MAPGKLLPTAPVITCRIHRGYINAKLKTNRYYAFPLCSYAVSCNFTRGDVTITVDGSGFEHVSRVQMSISVVERWNVTYIDDSTAIVEETSVFHAVCTMTAKYMCMYMTNYFNNSCMKWDVCLLIILNVEVYLIQTFAHCYCYYHQPIPSSGI